MSRHTRGERHRFPWTEDVHRTAQRPEVVERNMEARQSGWVPLHSASMGLPPLPVRVSRKVAAFVPTAGPVAGSGIGRAEKEFEMRYGRRSYHVGIEEPLRNREEDLCPPSRAVGHAHLAAAALSYVRVRHATVSRCMVRPNPVGIPGEASTDCLARHRSGPAGQFAGNTSLWAWGVAWHSRRWDSPTATSDSAPMGPSLAHLRGGCMMVRACVMGDRRTTALRGAAGRRQ